MNTLHDANQIALQNRIDGANIAVEAIIESLTLADKKNKQPRYKGALYLIKKMQMENELKLLRAGLR